MNYFIEGLQGSGKSTLVEKLSKRYPDCTVFREGDYSPVELAWCARVTKKRYALLAQSTGSGGLLQTIFCAAPVAQNALEPPNTLIKSSFQRLK